MLFRSVGYHSFSFFDTTTGATSQQRIALNDNLWKLVDTSLTITRVAGSTSWGYRNYLNAASGTFKFELVQNGAIVLSQDLGTGLESNPYTILDLRDAN